MSEQTSQAALAPPRVLLALDDSMTTSQWVFDLDVNSEGLCYCMILALTQVYDKVWMPESRKL
jgi:hypothetical protein